MELNILFCGSNLHVRIFLIANKLASVKAFVASLTAPKFAFAPIAA